MTRTTLFLAAALLATPAFGQTTAATVEAPAAALPDCRDLLVGTKPGTRCQFRGTNIPTEEYLGTVSLPSDDQTRIYGVPGAPFVAPHKHRYSFDVTTLFTVQSENFAYRSDSAQGTKVDIFKQWSDLLGLDVRGVEVENAWFNVGKYPGNDHTWAITAGPRVQHQFGRVRPYFSPLFGWGHQEYYMFSVSAAAGADLFLTKRFQWVLADAEYRWAAFQPSTAQLNPLRGRIELSTGIAYHFGYMGYPPHKH